MTRGRQTGDSRQAATTRARVHQPRRHHQGRCELAEQVGIDNLSMPLLGKHLGVGVTSIYWYFRKKDDLLNAMTDRALRTYVFATRTSRPPTGARPCAITRGPCERPSWATRFCAI